MIKFFRKIRYNLMETGKTGNPAFAKASVGTYLKYAIGEIVLVVIGILIALQINNWNENRKEKVMEFVLVQKLLEQTVADSLLFEGRMKGLMSLDSVLVYVLNMNATTPKALPDRYLTGNLLDVAKFNTGSNLIRNHSEDFNSISNLNLREDLMDYAYLTTMMNGALDLYNQNLQEYLIPLTLKYYSQLKAFDTSNTLSEMSSIFKNEDIEARFDLFRGLNANAIQQIQNLMDKNKEVAKRLRTYKKAFL